MPVKLEGGDNMKRRDYFSLNPFNIQIREELRGRHKAPDEESIVALAESMMENGQQQPVVIRRQADNTPLLISGFTRTAAARLIRDGFKDRKGEHRQNADFMINANLTDANDETAFRLNIVENAHRNQTSPIDDAKNQHRLRESHAMSEDEIADLYKYPNTQKVARLRRLLALPEKLQDLVHDGILRTSAAIDLLDITDVEAQKAAFDQVLADYEANGKIKSSEVRSRVRETLLNDDHSENEQHKDSEGGKKTKSKGLSMKEVREFFDVIIAEEEQAEDLVTFAKTALAWLGGRRTNKSMMKAIDDLYKAKGK